MNFIFEDLDKFENFISCTDVNVSGIKRFTPSPFVTTLIQYKINNKQLNNFDVSSIKLSNDPGLFERYIIASGVNHSPDEWYGPHRTNLFMHLPDQYFKDLQNRKAFLLLDQTHEGYHEEWLYDRIHLDCEFFGINPSQIIYVTGNLKEADQYDKWIKYKLFEGKMCVIPYAHFEKLILEKSQLLRNDRPLLKFENQLEYKLQHIDKIKTFNCLQKRSRPHRIWMFRELWKHGLISDNIISMNMFDFDKTYYMNKFMDENDYNQFSKLLPILPPGTQIEHPFSHHSCGRYLTTINEDIMADSWVSVISEASFGEDTCFISEKSFKPIAAMHPFIIFGNKFSLKYLRELGYKTFQPYIDETYDKLDTWSRLDAIIQELKRLNSLSKNEKLKMFKELEPILKHNYLNFVSNPTKNISISVNKIRHKINELE